MKKVLCVVALSLSILTGCSGDKYSLKEEKVSIEVKGFTDDETKVSDNVILFSPFTYLLLNDTELSKEQQKGIEVVTNIDFNKLGEYTLSYKKDDKEITDTLKITVQDTTKPTLKLEGNEFEVGTDLKGKVVYSDNYDDIDTLQAKLSIKGYNASQVGTQKVTISIEDSSGNKESIEKEITVIEKKKEESEVGVNANTPQNDNQYNHYPQITEPTDSDYTNSNEKIDDYIPTTPPVVEEPVSPPVACPGGMDRNLPCDFTPNNIGNTGLIFNTMEEAYKYAESQGWPGNSYSVGALNYNGGYIKYTITKF